MPGTAVLMAAESIADFVVPPSPMRVAARDTPSSCADRAPNTWRYLFASDAAGQIGAVDSWDSDDTSPAPSWFREICH